MVAVNVQDVEEEQGESKERVMERRHVGTVGQYRASGVVGTWVIALMAAVLSHSKSSEGKRKRRLFSVLIERRQPF